MSADGPTTPAVTLHLGDCLDVFPTLPDASVDCVVTDPPYPEISRAYGRMSEVGWHAMMRAVVTECRRVLKPKGSAVFVLQPNSEKIGRTRLWLWEFLVWAGREWGIVQDAWWWNTAALPVGGSNTHGLLRASLKACVWCGLPDCYRDQDSVLWSESHRNAERRATERFSRVTYPSGLGTSSKIFARAVERGGTTPFNVLPIPNTNSTHSAGSHGHGAGTPAALCNWWVRYLCPPGGTVLDPFLGSGTVALEAVKLGRNAVGIERHEPYHALCRSRIDAALNETPLFNNPPVPA